jgi:ATP-dependent DNA helicase RecQ
VFGHAEFKGLQAPVIAEVMAGRDALAVLPTGGGKSLCYQIPALLRPGVGLVVSPLIALMTDQVEALRQLGVRAARMDSGLSPEERERTWKALKAGAIDLIYLSPEGLSQAFVLERLAATPIALVAIDEAHCVSQWGHDFRPEYRALGRLADVFPGVPRLAVTATADQRTREDIRAQLRLGTAADFVASFARRELALSAERKSGASAARVTDLVAARKGASGIVYCGSRAGSERLAEALSSKGLPARAYHAGLEATTRRDRQNWFRGESDAVMTATIAFGMGIDKPDVRFVIHADPPAAIESYWQEVGRAGRDGERAEGLTLYGASDMAWALERIRRREISEDVTRVQMRKVRQLYAMLDGTACRAQAVRRYFGELETTACGCCDRCLSPPVGVDVSDAARRALSAAQRLGGRFGRGRLVDHLLGRTKGVREDEAVMSTYGIGQDLAPGDWRDLIEQLLFEGLLTEVPNEGRPLIALADREGVRQVYRAERSVTVLAPPRRSGERAVRARANSRAAAPALGEHDATLFEALRAWRKEEARGQAAPPYVIFHDRTLAEIARARPGSRNELARVGGVGEAKLVRYADAVLRIVADQCRAESAAA